MADLVIAQNHKRFNVSWVPEVFFRPRRAFQQIAGMTTAVWITPLLILSFFVMINVLISGRIKNQAAMSGEITYPPDFQYYTPEQQAQYTQAIQSTQGPVFVYVLPAITSLIGVWLSWLILGGVLHLIATLLGGRGNTAISMNIVAWASLPLALRSVVQIIYMLATKNLIVSQGLSGFSPTGDAGWMLFITQILKLIDIYIVWQLVLMILGVHIATGLSKFKSTGGVLLSIFLIILLKAGLYYLVGVLGNLTITRPFFF
jgi:Yip1 domain